MMIPSRRQFVATIATVPFLPAIAGAQGRAPASDPVMDQILDDLRSLSTEFEKQPGNRKSTLRAMESTLGIGAAHLAAHYDADFRRQLRRAQSRRSSRAALIQDLVEQGRARGGHPVTYDAVDSALTRLDQHGLSGAFRDVQQTIRKVRLQAPDQVQLAGFSRAQFDYCSDLNWMIGILESITLIACGISVLEPTVGGEIACGALMLALGLLYAQRLWFC